MNAVLLVTAMLLWAVPSTAQHQHIHVNTKGPNGGRMQDVAGIHAELVVDDRTLTVYTFDEEGQPLSARGYTGSVSIVSRGNHETVPLAPLGQTALRGKAQTRPGPDASFTIALEAGPVTGGQGLRAR
jgi:nitrogen fixation protein FixH